MSLFFMKVIESRAVLDVSVLVSFGGFLVGSVGGFVGGSVRGSAGGSFGGSFAGGGGGLPSFLHWWQFCGWATLALHLCLGKKAVPGGARGNTKHHLFLHVRHISLISEAKKKDMRWR